MNKEINIYIASNLKYLRNLNNKTQEDIGKICNKTFNAVSYWEKGTRQPNAVDIGILAQYFNVSVDDFLLKDLRNEKSYKKPR